MVGSTSAGSPKSKKKPRSAAKSKRIRERKRPRQLNNSNRVQERRNTSNPRTIMIGNRAVPTSLIRRWLPTTTSGFSNEQSNMNRYRNAGQVGGSNNGISEIINVHSMSSVSNQVSGNDEPSTSDGRTAALIEYERVQLGHLGNIFTDLFAYIQNNCTYEQYQNLKTSVENFLDRHTEELAQARNNPNPSARPSEMWQSTYPTINQHIRTALNNPSSLHLQEN